MRFIKMHGTGNDYIYIDCFQESVSAPERLAVELCRPHFGVGSDGIILIEPSKEADCKMKMYNADGSEGMMCGNGIRCVGKYVYEYGIVPKHHITVETMSGMKELYLETEGNRVTSVTVNMGHPILKEAISMTEKGILLVIHPVSMGNPHGVIWVTDTECFPVKTLGPLLEHASVFPNGCNIEFAHILSRSRIRMRVWERGSQETLSCGSGACAVFAAAYAQGLVKEEITVELAGGELYIRTPDAGETVFLKGPAEVVFEGSYLGKTSVSSAAS